MPDDSTKADVDSCKQQLESAQSYIASLESRNTELFTALCEAYEVLRLLCSKLIISTSEIYVLVLGVVTCLLSPCHQVRDNTARAATQESKNYQQVFNQLSPYIVDNIRFKSNICLT